MLFSRGVNCDRTAGRIEMPLGKNVRRPQILLSRNFRGPKWSYFVNFRCHGRSGPPVEARAPRLQPHQPQDDPALSVPPPRSRPSESDPTKGFREALLALPADDRKRHLQPPDNVPGALNAPKCVYSRGSATNAVLVYLERERERVYLPQHKEQTYKDIVNKSTVAGYQKGKPIKLVAYSTNYYTGS